MSLWLKASHATVTKPLSNPSPGLQAHERAHQAWNPPGTCPPPSISPDTCMAYFTISSGPGSNVTALEGSLLTTQAERVHAVHSWSLTLLHWPALHLSEPDIMLNFNYPFMVGFSYLEAHEGRYFVLFDAISLTPRAPTALNTCLCTQAYQHPHLHREKQRGKTETGLKSAPLSFWKPHITS